MTELEAFRYTLTRQVSPLLHADSRGLLLWVMLNPSTADEVKDDPTIRKCKGFAKRWGFAWFRVVNLFALRATKPVDLWQAQAQGYDVVGPSNNLEIITGAEESSAVCVAWGRVPKQAHARRDEVLELLWGAQKVRELLSVGVNMDGSPMHPLMAPYTNNPVQWKVRKAAA